MVSVDPHVAIVGDVAAAINRAFSIATVVPAIALRTTLLFVPRLFLIVLIVRLRFVVLVSSLLSRKTKRDGRIAVLIEMEAELEGRCRSGEASSENERQNDENDLAHDSSP